MSVLMPNTRATVRRRLEGALNAHGERTVEGFADPEEMLPALVKERGDGGFTIGLDDSLWPVRVGDAIVEESGRVYLVQSTALLTNSVDSTVNWVRTDALWLDVDGTDPADGWTTGRH